MRPRCLPRITSVKTILNISAYRFTWLDKPDRWCADIRSAAGALGLKGTAIVAEEGLNLFFAGAESNVRKFLAWLRGHPKFIGLSARESWSSEVPFERLMVKVKAEIIRMNQPTIRPQTGRAPAVDPLILARWLAAGVDDTGRPVVMLDTRNAFEVDLGRFFGAVDWRLAKFSDFPKALRSHREALAGKTIVSYCTGGIRCEKAALLMAEQGLPGTLQLDGGILGYFDAHRLSGVRHFEGNCFVFDQRAALDDTLAAHDPDQGRLVQQTSAAAPLLANTS